MVKDGSDLLPRSLPQGDPPPIDKIGEVRAGVGEGDSTRNWFWLPERCPLGAPSIKHVRLLIEGSGCMCLSRSLTPVLWPADAATLLALSLRARSFASDAALQAQLARSDSTARHALTDSLNSTARRHSSTGTLRDFRPAPMSHCHPLTH